jgi:hypothetical protein
MVRPGMMRLRFARWMHTDSDARNTDAISEIPR